MNKKLKKALKSAFCAPKPTRKLEFLNSLYYPKATYLEFCLSQIGYIRKRFWCLSILSLVVLVAISLNLKQDYEVVGILSAILPLLTLISITEIRKSISFNMAELEMSCKYNFGKITLIRLSSIAVCHFVILSLALLIFKNQSQYGMIRYSLYAVTPFLLSSYLSFWVTNHIKSKDTLYVCSGVTAFISISVIVMSSGVTAIYEGNYTMLWGVAFITIAALLIKEIYFLLTERTEQWSLA